MTTRLSGGAAPGRGGVQSGPLAGWHLGIIAYPVRGNVIEITAPLAITHDEVTTASHLLTEAIDWATLGHVTDDDIAPTADGDQRPLAMKRVASTPKASGTPGGKGRLHVRGSLLDAGISEPERWLTSQSD